MSSPSETRDMVIVLDFMPEGKSIGKPTGPIAQVLREVNFTLHELDLKSDVTMQLIQRIDLKNELANKIIKRRTIIFDKLTDTSQNKTEEAIIALIDHNEQRFVDFYNNATPVTTRLHKLELLPGVGKKYLWDFINQRKKRPFASFKDISERVKISDPRKAIVRRILMELKSTDEKYYLFLSHPRSKDLIPRGYSSSQGRYRRSNYGDRRPY